MAMYRRRSEKVEAVKHRGRGHLEGAVPHWLWDAVLCGQIGKVTEAGELPLFDGKDGRLVAKGDWIVHDLDGVLSVVSGEEFYNIYESMG